MPWSRGPTSWRSFNQDTSVELTPIVSRKAAMAYFWSNQIVAVWKAAGGDERNLSPASRCRGFRGASRPNFLKPSQFFSVTTHAKQPKEAAMFIDFVTNSIEANEVLLAERGVPISSKVQKALMPKLGASQSEMFAYLDRVSKDVQPIPPPDPAGAHRDRQERVTTRRWSTRSRSESSTRTRVRRYCDKRPTRSSRRRSARLGSRRGRSDAGAADAVRPTVPLLSMIHTP